ncbi:tyrosine-type recombinase/integrase [Dysgonomonas sp. BGC7]|uniref:tyrosine-type recombinase/integrase n=1 Tax=Dysgonomonas sp. BGC7 TaxID=1658008 RepID=UPI0012F979F0|nr:tyrosine-type recombinase/integrase [Dysgonomonas sp. BGC7]
MKYCDLRISLFLCFFHIHRHTFATTVMLDNGATMETLTSVLGHRSIKNTQIYGKITQRKVFNEMVAIEKKIVSFTEMV